MKSFIVLLICLFVTGCATLTKDEDRRAITGKLLIDVANGKNYIAEYDEDACYFLHELLKNGGVLYFKGTEEN